MTNEHFYASSHTETALCPGHCSQQHMKMMGQASPSKQQHMKPAGIPAGLTGFHPLTLLRAHNLLFGCFLIRNTRHCKELG